MRRSSRRSIAVAVVALAAVTAGALLGGWLPCQVLVAQPSCYVAIAPGPITDTRSAVVVGSSSGIAARDGSLLATTVEVDEPLTAWTWLRSIASPAVAIAPREAFFPDGIDLEELHARNARAMDDSKTAAIIAALRSARVDTAMLGARVVALEPGPTASLLEIGDLIIGIDDQEVSEAAAVVNELRLRSPGERATLAVYRHGRTRLTSIVLGADPDNGERAWLGVRLTDAVTPPVAITIDAGAVGGPSAGLMFALEIVDQLTDGDLTGALTIAGTGAIDRQGQVAPVGGVRQKIVAATSRADGPPAQAFLLPRANMSQARGAPVGRALLLVPVDSLDEALAALAALRAGDRPSDSLMLVS